MPSKRKLYGVGVNNADFKIKENGVIDLSYVAWKSMLTRCFSEKYHKKRPTYRICTICDDWVYYMNFKKWYDDNFVEGWAIDKDLISDGNSHYSPETCFFVPAELNSLFTNCKKKGDLPVGVMLHKQSGKYRARLSVDNRRVSLGLFDDPISAGLAYKRAKTKYSLDKIHRLRNENKEKDRFVMLLNILEERLTPQDKG